MLGELGKGSFGTVVRVAEAATGAEYALKLLPAGGEADRVRREIQVSLSLDHPHLLRFVAGDVEGDVAWLAMELAEGSLEDLLGDPRRQQPAWARLREAAGAVAHLHASGLVHRDLKPENILLAGDAAKVADLGLARGEQFATLTRTGTIMGSPLYMAPEQARGERAGPAADTWALGVIAYRILEGVDPYPDLPMGELLVRVARGSTDPLQRSRGWLPPEIRKAVEAALDPDPAGRPRDLAAWGAALGTLPETREAPTRERTIVEDGTQVVGTVTAPIAAAAPDPAPAPAPVPVEEPSPTRSRPVALGALALLGVALGMVFTDAESPPPPPSAEAPETRDEDRLEIPSLLALRTPARGPDEASDRLDRLEGIERKLLEEGAGAAHERAVTLLLPELLAAAERAGRLREPGIRARVAKQLRVLDRIRYRWLDELADEAQLDALRRMRDRVAGSLLRLLELPTAVTASEVGRETHRRLEELRVRCDTQELPAELREAEQALAFQAYRRLEPYRHDGEPPRMTRAQILDPEHPIYRDVIDPEYQDSFSDYHEAAVMWVWNLKKDDLQTPSFRDRLEARERQRTHFEWLVRPVLLTDALLMVNADKPDLDNPAGRLYLPHRKKATAFYEKLEEVAGAPSPFMKEVLTAAHCFLRTGRCWDWSESVLGDLEADAASGDPERTERLHDRVLRLAVLLDNRHQAGAGKCGEQRRVLDVLGKALAAFDCLARPRVSYRVYVSRMTVERLLHLDLRIAKDCGWVRNPEEMRRLGERLDRLVEVYRRYPDIDRERWSTHAARLAKNLNLRTADQPGFRELFATEPVRRSTARFGELAAKLAAED